MDRKSFLKGVGAAGLLSLLPKIVTDLLPTPAPETSSLMACAEPTLPYSIYFPAGTFRTGDIIYSKQMGMFHYRENEEGGVLECITDQSKTIKVKNINERQAQVIQFENLQIHPFSVAHSEYNTNDHEWVYDFKKSYSTFTVEESLLLST